MSEAPAHLSRTPLAQRGGAARFTEGPVAGHVIRLAGFMVMGFVAMTTAQLVEAVYLGIVGTDELAAIAFTFPIVLTLNAAARGIGVGASAVIARVMGSGDRERARVLVTHCLVLVLVFSLLCTAFGIPYSQAVFAALGAEGRVLELADRYMQIWYAGFAFFAVSMVGTNLLRSIGDAATPGVVMTAGSLLQMLFGPFLIFGWLGLPALGIEGAALAFVLARVSSFALCMYWIARVEHLLVVRWSALGASWRSIMHVGVPATLTNLVAPLSTAVLTRLLADFGHAVVAGFGVASRVDAMMAMIVIAVSSAVGPFVGQNWGARQFERVQAALSLCNRFCLVWGLFSFLVMLAAGRWLVGLINDDAAVVETAFTYLLVVPFSLGFMGVMNVASGCFNALSKPTPPLVLSALRLVVVLIPLALIGRAWFGPTGVFGALAIANVAVGVIAWSWNRRMLHREVQRLEAEITTAAAGS